MNDQNPTHLLEPGSFLPILPQPPAHCLCLVLVVRDLASLQSYMQFVGLNGYLHKSAIDGQTRLYIPKEECLTSGFGCV